MIKSLPIIEHGTEWDADLHRLIDQRCSDYLETSGKTAFRITCKLNSNEHGLLESCLNNGNISPYYRGFPERNGVSRYAVEFKPLQLVEVIRILLSGRARIALEVTDEEAFEIEGQDEAFELAKAICGLLRIRLFRV